MEISTRTNPRKTELDEVLVMIGEVGRRLSEINACEGAAGNISVCVRGALELADRFKQAERVALPMAIPELTGATFVVTGSGCRLREVMDNPEANLGCLVVEPGGQTAQMRTSPRRAFARLTSEFNSHLAVHYDAFLPGDTDLHAVVHAQPPHLTYLSHLAAYQERGYLNRHLLRWQPETIIQMPEGLEVMPFLVPGSSELAAATRQAMRGHKLVIWSKHGVMARSAGSVQHAADLIEYAEAAARYEYLNLAAGEPADGLSVQEIRAICEATGVEQTIF